MHFASISLDASSFACRFVRKDNAYGLNYKNEELWKVKSCVRSKKREGQMHLTFAHSLPNTYTMRRLDLPRNVDGLARRLHLVELPLALRAPIDGRRHCRHCLVVVLVV
jgi:hypothetical protein